MAHGHLYVYGSVVGSCLPATAAPMMSRNRLAHQVRCFYALDTCETRSPTFRWLTEFITHVFHAFQGEGFRTGVRAGQECSQHPRTRGGESESAVLRPLPGPGPAPPHAREAGSDPEHFQGKASNSMSTGDLPTSLTASGAGAPLNPSAGPRPEEDSDGARSPATVTGDHKLGASHRRASPHRLEATV